MKISKLIKLASTVSAVAASLTLFTTVSGAQTVHQSLGGDAARTGENASAVEKKVVETKETPEGVVARVAGSVTQWGYVNYWFGLPAPAGKATLRFNIYVEDPEQTNSYAAYIKREGQDPLVLRFKLPADAKKDSFVNVDVNVDVPQEWNCVTLKKIVANDQPGYWIKSISVILP